MKSGRASTVPSCPEMGCRDDLDHLQPSLVLISGSPLRYSTLYIVRVPAVAELFLSTSPLGLVKRGLY